MNFKNIPLNTFRAFLKHKGLKCISTNGGHEKWSKQNLKRPVIIQSHFDPVPEFIIRNNLRSMECSTKEFEIWLDPFKK